MSAFIVSRETINRVVFSFKEVRDNALLNSDELGRKLYAMNTRAVNARYNEKNQSPVYFYSLKKLYTKIEQLKACQCLRYQCSEGNVPEEQLYQQLEAHIEHLQSSIINSLPEYELAAWDA